jgi:hypothetical protein
MLHIGLQGSEDEIAALQEVRNNQLAQDNMSAVE